MRRETLSQEEIASLPRCLAPNCVDPLTAVIYNRIADRFRHPDELIALTYACDKHVRMMARACLAEADDIEYLPNHIPF
jgi:hypothetical protein